MNLYDYELPESAIAQEPLSDRSASRLLVMDRASGARQHRHFSDLPEFLRAGDLLVVNETRVIPARLRARRPGGGKAEIFLVRALPDGRWLALVKPSARIKPGSEVALVDHAEGPAGRVVVEDSAAGGLRTVRFPEGEVAGLIARAGAVPLPPYIRRSPEEADRERYQTVFARVPGAVAAPTAGLHLTDPLIARLREQGVAMARLVLHVGPGTFRPVQVDDPRDHQIDAEWCSIPAETAALVSQARERGGRVVAVGTTTTRALEAAARQAQPLAPFEGFVDLYIHPPFEFRVVDALITNFHLPRSSLLLLVSAFAGREHVLAAYREAVLEGYRFYSYGDAMLLA
ncbi:MAG TPA: tRNA preQ1(34) S-adenosylmethionine ribosyltransferase-isomerase QueA [Candidatus Eisenbacteria bacterium]|nr:tRNA preQ1(34) S-adenosylmethionine ribosyltransferase-isomerase QueA [Candidatus Eisenbacteria bacterium]